MGDVTNRKGTAPLPKIERKEDGILKVQVTGEDSLQLIFGTETNELAEGLLMQCVNALNGAEPAEQDFMVAAVKEIGPRDGLEGMLATQMAAVHVATIRMAGRLARADTLPTLEAYDRALNRLARTFTAQVEALRKQRNGGEQKVTVQHVNVGDGGKAIVGNVAQRGRGEHKNER